MKKFGTMLIFVLLMSAFSTAQAEIKAGTLSLTPFLGICIFEGNQDIHKDENFITYGFRGGYNFTEHWAVQGSVSYTQVEIEGLGWHGEPWQDIFSYNIEGLYHFMPRGRFVPFIATGLGFTHYSEGLDAYNDPDYYEQFDSDRLTLDYGGGLKFFLTENFALQADVRHFLSFNSREGNPHHIHHDLLTSFGISYAFGAEKKEVEEAPKEEVQIQPAPAPVAVDRNADSDRDGIPDYRDDCPSSPAGVAVDKHGCLPDSDGDGILDYEDRCQGTPSGVKINKYGCPPDYDGDGVYNYLDKCPRTPKGTSVGKDGCTREKESMLLKMEFDAGKALISRKYHKEIKRVADFMEENPKATATIVGHTDNIGNRKDNIKLSRARAENVRNYLIEKFDIKASRIKAVGYGPDRPTASNKTKEGRQKNRRVFAIFKIDQ